MSGWAWLGVYCASVFLLWLLLLAVLAASGRGMNARELLAFVPDCVVLFRRLAADPDVPRGAKRVLGATAVYLVLPIDLIPDFVPGLGLLDDAVLAGLATRYVIRRAGRERVEQHWQGSEAGLRTILALAG
jgi:uncharacterized membrane protein YkvA (DUF1232 family)